MRAKITKKLKNSLDDELKREVALLPKDSLIGGYQRGGFQVNFRYHDMTLYTVKRIMSQESMNRMVITDIRPVPLTHEPFDLTGNIRGNITDLDVLLEKIAKREYPDKVQGKYLRELRNKNKGRRENPEKLGEKPRKLETLAFLQTCHNCDCLCPLFFSLGCRDFIDQEIKYPGTELDYEPEEMMEKPSFAGIIDALVEYRSSDEINRKLRKIAENEENEELLMEGYG